MSGYSRFYDEGSGSSSSSEQEASKASTYQRATVFNVSSSSSSGERERREVKTLKEKRYDELRDVLNSIANKVRIGDWADVFGTYKDFEKQLSKLDKAKFPIPRFSIKAILELKRDVDEVRSQKKKLSRAKGVAVNKIRSRVKGFIQKYQVKETLEDFKDEEKAAEPDEAGSGSDSESGSGSGSSSGSDSSDSDSGSGSDSDSSSGSSSSGSGSDSDSDSSDSDSSDSSSSDSDDEEQLALKRTREYWTLAFTQKEDEARALRKKQAQAARLQERKDRLVRRKAAAELKKQRAKEKQQKTKEKVTGEKIVALLKDILKLRGHKNQAAQLPDQVRQLMKHAVDPITSMKLKVTLIALLFDNSRSSMPADQWSECAELIKELLADLKKNSDTIRLTESSGVQDAFDQLQFDKDGQVIVNSSKASEEDGEESKEEAEDDGDKPDVDSNIAHVQGNLLAHLMALYRHLETALKQLDPHSETYITRMKDELTLLQLVESAEEYYGVLELTHRIAQCKYLRLEMIYYHYFAPLDVFSAGFTGSGTDIFGNKMQGWDDQKSSRPDRHSMIGGDDEESGSLTISSQLDLDAYCVKEDTVDNLVRYLYEHGDDREKTRALLFQVYHKSVHNRYQDARRLLLMSHLQDSIDNCGDNMTRCLFNRTLTQLGLSAFRAGETREALHTLYDVYQSYRTKEVLGQGISNRFWHRDTDERQEQIDRLIQLPYHMHINLDSIEASYLLSAMFQEAPLLAQPGVHREKTMYFVMRQFRKHYSISQRRAFQGPPENTRDLVVAATNCLLEGDWQQAQRLVFRLKMWASIANSDQVQARISHLLRTHSLKCYLLTYITQYESVSLADLVEKFGLQREEVFRIASRLIVKDQLPASWDTEGVLRVIGKPSTGLQTSAMSFASKLQVLVEQNEKVLKDFVFGGRHDFGGRFQRGGGYRNFRGEGGRGGRGGRSGRGRFRGGRRDGGFRNKRW